MSEDLTTNHGPPTPFVIQPTETHLHTIILFHGRDSSGPEFVSDLFDNDSDESSQVTHQYETRANVPPDPDNVRRRLPNWKWVFPSAPPSHFTTFKQDLTEWFDVYSLDDPAARPELQVPGLKASITYALELIRDEASKLSTSKGCLVLGGISQGAVMATHALLFEYSKPTPAKVGAFVGFSTWLPFSDKIQSFTDFSYMSKAGATIDKNINIRAKLSSLYIVGLGLGERPSDERDDESMRSLKEVPALLEHCQDDDVVDIALGRAMSDTLKDIGLDVLWKEHERGYHWIKEPEGLNDLVGFLRFMESKAKQA